MICKNEMINYIIKVLFFTFIAVIILILLFCGLLVMLFGRKVDKNNIIKKFEQNIEMFNESVGELSEEEICIEKREGEYIITIYKELPDGTTDLIIVEEKYYDKYQESINLMKKLKIDVIYKYQENVVFLFNSMIGTGQYIVKMDDEERYMKTYIVTYKEQIDGSWYYIETK